MIDPPKESKLKFSLQSISTREQIQKLIDDFEINDELREKGKLSLVGLYSLQQINVSFHILNFM
jgi:hypothetical protein